MGKCISKHPSVLTIALSEKDLANTNQIWSKFTESSERMTLNDDAVCNKHGNQLWEHESNYFVTTTDGDRKQQQQQQHQQQQQEEIQLNRKTPKKSCQYNSITKDFPTLQSSKDLQPQGLITSNSKCYGDDNYDHDDNNDDEDDNKTDAVMHTDAHSAFIAIATTTIPSSIVVDMKTKVDDPSCPNYNEYDDAGDDGGDGDDDIYKLYKGDIALVVPNNVAVKCTCIAGDSSSSSYNKNISQYDGQLCLAHLHLLQNQTLVAKNNFSNEIILENYQQAYNMKDSYNRNNNNNNNNNNKCLNPVYHKKFRNNVNQRHHDGYFDIDAENRLYIEETSINDVHNGNCCSSEQHLQGQIESKKSLKKHGANATIETKGTAMSFGFRKKLNSTPKKLKKLIEGSGNKHDKCNNPNQNVEDEHITTVIESQEKKRTTENYEHKDNNGNAETIINDKTHCKKIERTPIMAQKSKSTTKEGVAIVTGNQQQTNLPGANNRFGFRGIIRPASTSGDGKDNIVNNNSNNPGNFGSTTTGLVSNLKRRSKSAHTSRSMTSNQGNAADTEADGATTTPPKINQPKTLTFNLSHNSTIEYQRQQFFQQPPPPPQQSNSQSGRFSSRSAQHQHSLINTGMHTNVIVRPTPRAPPATFSRFTLHTTSLPKPEFPIAISLSTTSTPTTPGGGTFSPSTLSTVSSGIRSRESQHQHQVQQQQQHQQQHQSQSQFQQQQQQQHPLTAVAAQTQYQFYMDPKAAKHVANSTTRRGFSGSREISADSGIASIDMALESSGSSGRSASPPKRSRSRPRNLQMVMNGRHKFEVRDVDDTISSESSSIAVETLALPKLPIDNQTAPLPLHGLVRSNTVLSRSTNETTKLNETKTENVNLKLETSNVIMHNVSDDSEGREEKLYLDRSASEKNKAQYRDINTCSSKTSSPGSSIMMSWCHAGGEALATQDTSINASIANNDDSNKTLDQIDDKKAFSVVDLDLQLDLNDEDLNTISSDMNFSPISSNYEPTQSARTFTLDPVKEITKIERPKQLLDNDDAFGKKFAEMALAGSEFLIDDETSPTDSLVSSTASDEIADKKKKHKFNEELQEKDIDEISPILEVGSPISPGTPTHASRSLSLSDCGNLIDDEIADQPALLFNNETQQDGAENSITSRRDKTDTPTLMESVSMRPTSIKSKTRTVLQNAIELTLRTPVSLRKKIMERAESMDTLSPCESICSDDLMMDFDMESSIDSIDHAASMKSRSGSDLNKIDDTELYSELERQGTDLMKELDTMLRAHQQNRGRDKNRVAAHLPARATRLLNRSRLQQQYNFNADSPDSAKSSNSLRRSANASSRASSNGSMHHHKQTQQHQQNQQIQLSPHMQRSHRSSMSSSDDLMLNDKSFRNAMIQDVLQFKKQLLRLRRILQETETINPFDLENGQQSNSNGGLDLEKDADIISLISTSLDEPIEDFNDLRRQVVYLQSQIDERDRTIRLQRDLIDKLEAEKATFPRSQHLVDAAKECINMATQTERTRPLAIGTEGLTRSKPEYTSYTTYFPENLNDSCAIIQHQHQQQQQLQEQQQQSSKEILLNGNNNSNTNTNSNGDRNNNSNNNNNSNKNNDKYYNDKKSENNSYCIQSNKPLNQTRRHTIISTTLTNYNAQLSQVQQHHHHHHHHHHQQQLQQQQQQGKTTPRRRASVGWENCKISNEQFSTSNTNNASTTVYKPVRITLIGDTLKQWNDELKAIQNGEVLNINKNVHSKYVNNVNGVGGGVDGGCVSIGGENKDLSNSIVKENENNSQISTKKLQQFNSAATTAIAVNTNNKCNSNFQKPTVTIV